jgi:hypothetical protein
VGGTHLYPDAPTANGAGSRPRTCPP